MTEIGSFIEEPKRGSPLMVISLIIVNQMKHHVLHNQLTEIDKKMSNMIDLEIDLNGNPYRKLNNKSRVQ